jgi:ribosomal protein S18 acetylase RimI-like enzyme
MSVVTTSIHSSQPKQLRPFDPRRDMLAVADLIESCFSPTLDPDGKRYLRRMRATANRTASSRWIPMVTSMSTLPMAGFVWVENGQVVGNLSLVPFFSRGRRINLIANVAVHPEYRRKGIARALTKAALEKSQKRFASATWLQVRHDNQAAIKLYTGMGFSPEARRTTWVSSPHSLKGEGGMDARVTYRRSVHWTHQASWLEQNYPTELRWHFPLKMLAMKPGFWGWLYRLINEIDVRHWAIQRGGKLLGVLSWQQTRRYADQVWLAAPPEYEDQVIKNLSPYLSRDRSFRRPISLDYPENRAVDTLKDAGFEATSTLIWMEVKHDWSSPNS